MFLWQDDDGFVLYESRAICRYLAEKYADQGTPNLIPTELKAKALFEQAASIEYANFNPYAFTVFLGGCVSFPSTPSDWIVLSVFGDAQPERLP